MKASNFHGFQQHSDSSGFTLIELLVVIAIIAILAVVVVLTLNPAQLLAQSRDANRVSDMATLQSAINLYVTDQAGASTFNLGGTASTGISIYDPNGSSTCGSLGLPSLGSSTWYCATSTSSRSINGYGWIPVNLSLISAGAPIGSLPLDPTNQTSTGLFYAYNTNGSQFEVTGELESQKYKAQYGNSPQTTAFPEVIFGGNPTVSALFNPAALVGYWPLNEGSGSSTIDASGNGNIGTWSGTATGTTGTYYAGGKVGAYAGYFDGSTNYINLGTSTILKPTGALTISAWLKPNSISGLQRLISSYTGTSQGFFLGPSSSAVKVVLGNGSSLATVTSLSGALSIETWTFVAATWDGATLSLYINGILASSTAIAGLSYASSANVRIGEDPTGSDPVNGIVDDVRIYSRALSVAEVEALYLAQR